MTKNDVAGLEPGLLLDVHRQRLADAAAIIARPAKGIGRIGRRVSQVGHLRALGDNHEAEHLAGLVALDQVLADLGDGGRHFGNDDEVGAAGQSANQSHPARLAAHRLNDHHALVSGGRGVQVVEGVHDTRDGRVEADGVVGLDQVVVHRLGHADDVDAKLAEPCRRPRSVSRPPMTTRASRRKAP